MENIVGEYFESDFNYSSKSNIIKAIKDDK